MPCARKFYFQELAPWITWPIDKSNDETSLYNDKVNRWYSIFLHIHFHKICLIFGKKENEILHFSFTHVILQILAMTSVVFHDDSVQRLKFVYTSSNGWFSPETRGFWASRRVDPHFHGSDSTPCWYNTSESTKGLKSSSRFQSWLWR